LFVSFHCKYSEAYALEQTLLVQKIAAEHNGSDFVFVEEPNAKEELWKVGHRNFL
jgi:D-lactate dehydrogenase (cytochrome)